LWADLIMQGKNERFNYNHYTESSCGFDADAAGNEMYHCPAGIGTLTRIRN
jgi:hypothetical protein